MRAARLLPALLLSLAFAASASAQVADPTRPPAALLAPAPASGASAPHRAEPPAPPPAPRLQSVQLPREGRASALVDNHLVFVGDRLGGATVVAIDANGVQLRNGKGATERLSLIDPQLIRQTDLPAGAAPATVARLAGGRQP